METGAAASGSVETWERNSHKANTRGLFDPRAQPVLLQSLDAFSGVVVGGKSPFGRAGGLGGESDPKPMSESEFHRGQGLKAGPVWLWK